MWSTGAWDDPLGGRDLGHRLRHVLVVVLACTWLLGVAEMPAQPLYFPAWFAVAATVGLLVPIVAAFAVWRSRTRTLIALLSAAVAVVPTRRPWWPVVVGAVALVWAALLANVEHPEILDYRIWFIGAFNPAVVIVALRDRLRIAWGIIAVATALGSAVLLVRGEFAVQALVEGTYQTVIWAALGGSFRRFMDRMSRQARDEVAAQVLVDQGRELARARDEEISRRQASLDDEVVPMLVRIAAGQPLDEHDRIRCSLLQSTTRDKLVADTLLTPELAEAIRAARERRVTVAIAGRREDGASIDSFQKVAVAMLGRARPHDRVQLSWRPSPRGQVGSACLIGPGVGTLWPRGAASLDEAVDHGLSVDDDAVLVQFAAATSPSPPG